MNNEKKTVFTKSLFDFENVDLNNDKTVELYNRISETGDDRSKIILAGIIVEWYLDRILKCLFIDYKILTKRSDFTFSVKISILKSLRLIPLNIIIMCDCVRKIRNEFAHNLNIDNINQTEKKFKDQIHQLYVKNVENTSDIDLIKKFESVYRLGSSHLRTYEKNIILLRERIDDPNFEKELDKLNNERMFEFHQKLMEKEPIEIIERGNNEIEMKYSKSFGVIKKKK
ncbi:hypothetical protein [Polaribacter sp. M15]